MGRVTLLRGLSSVLGPRRNSLRRKIETQLSEVEGALASVVAGASSPVREAAELTLSAGGKRLRPALALLSGSRAEKGDSPAMDAALAVELVHMGSLLHDDVVDGSAHRRGKPAVHLVWSEGVAISAGDYLFAHAFTRLAGYSQAEMLSVLAETVGEMSWGELDQLQAAGSPFHEVEEYLAKIHRKTAVLFSAACRLGGMAAGADGGQQALLTVYGENLGMAFQICDDILDYVGSAEVLGKPRGGDLREGKMTLPAICALRGEAGPYVKEALSDSRPHVVGAAVEAVAGSPAISESRELAWSYAYEARKNAEQFPSRWARTEMLALTDYVVERSS